jgi:hypothetical protein
MGPDQRKHIRFLVQDNVIAALRSRFTKVGKVKDISAGGLSLEHIYDEDSNGEPSEREIYLLVNGFYMPEVPCKIVYDIPVCTPNEYHSLTIHLITRRCGVQFERLSEDQAAQLDFFLKTYTKGTTP